MIFLFFNLQNVELEDSCYYILIIKSVYLCITFTRLNVKTNVQPEFLMPYPVTTDLSIISYS